MIMDERKKLLIYGAGDMAGQFISEYDVLRKYSDEYDLVGLIDDKKTGAVNGIPIKGTGKDLPDLLNEGIDNILIFLLFNPVKRLDLCFKIKEMGYNFPSLINTYIPTQAKIGEGVYVHKSADFLGVNFEIGDFSIISAQTVIERSKIGKGVLIQPGAKVLYDSTIGDGTVMNANSICVPNTTIGKGCTININAIAHHNVADGKTIRTYDKLRGKNLYLPD
jgi:acetyltransferase-like isoleucine patch superfamily enzyme